MWLCVCIVHVCAVCVSECMCGIYIYCVPALPMSLCTSCMFKFNFPKPVLGEEMPQGAGRQWEPEVGECVERVRV